MRRLPVLPPARWRGADHPGRQGSGRPVGPGPARCHGDLAALRHAGRRAAHGEPSPGARRGPRDDGRLRHAPRGVAARRSPAGGHHIADGGPAAVRPGPGARPGRGGLHAGQDTRGGRRPRPRAADAPAPGRRAGRREADRRAADRVLRPAAGPPAGGPARPDRRPRRPAPRLLQVRPDRGDHAADVRDAAGPGPAVTSRKYGFRYAEGIPEAIADGVLALRSENQDSVLPLVQVICTQLYEREKALPGSDGVITREDLDAIKGVEGGLKAFAEDALVRSMRLGPEDREAFKASVQPALQSPDRRDADDLADAPREFAEPMGPPDAVRGSARCRQVGPPAARG